MKDSVKTDQKAEELVINWLEENKLPEEITETLWCNGTCECGETQCFEGSIYRIDQTIDSISVSICGACGDNDHLHSDVMAIN